MGKRRPRPARQADEFRNTGRFVLTSAEVREKLLSGLVIPAHPLALNADRELDERRQRALTRYYLDAGAGGLAVGVHTTQFGIREHGLFEPVLGLAHDTVAGRSEDDRPVLVAGIVGRTDRAVSEARSAVDIGYDAGLLSLAALPDATETELIEHCHAVAEVIPLFGFYLQTAVGGRRLDYGFWRRFAEIENAVAVKIAPFDRESTRETVRAICDAGRFDIALYTGNDDNMVGDLVTPFDVTRDGKPAKRFFDGGLLGQWAVWTSKAAELFERCRAARTTPDPGLDEIAVALTDANAAIFDSANDFAGCIPGIHEVLRRQGLLKGIWCLNESECLSPGQSGEIDRVCASYPFLTDDGFLKRGLDTWMA